MDVVIQPGAYVPKDVMKNDMVCHVAEGELRVVQNAEQFWLKKGDVWTCAKGTTETTFNDPGFKGSSQRLPASIVAPRQRLRRAFSSQGSFAVWH